jgi:hypothetical protein
MLGSAPGITRGAGKAVKLIGKFLLWTLAYAMGAALIFFLARRAEPPVTQPATTPVVAAPTAATSAAEPSVTEAGPPREDQEAAAPPALPQEATINPSSPPRRVKSIRIPRR